MREDCATFFGGACSDRGENDERERKRRAALGGGGQRREARREAPRGETITDDLRRMQAISCCAFAQLLEHLVCP